MLVQKVTSTVLPRVSQPAVSLKINGDRAVATSGDERIKEALEAILPEPFRNRDGGIEFLIPEGRNEFPWDFLLQRPEKVEEIELFLKKRFGGKIKVYPRYLDLPKGVGLYALVLLTLPSSALRETRPWLSRP